MSDEPGGEKGESVEVEGTHELPQGCSDEGSRVHPSRVTEGECEWCGAPFPESGPVSRTNYDPEGKRFDNVLLCSRCDRYGPPRGARRQRIELAWKIRPQMSWLERAAWRVIQWANR